MRGRSDRVAIALRALGAPLELVAARVRRHPASWFPSVLGLALAAAFAVGVLAEATIAADQAARVTLRASSPLARAVELTWQGPSTPAADTQARELFAELGLREQTRVVLLSQVRLSGIVVRPVGIAPLARWVAADHLKPLGPCTETSCPMLLVGGSLHQRQLQALGVHIRVVGTAPLRSPVPLGFSPATAGGPPVLATDDAQGLDHLAGLSGVYRTQDWISIPPLGRLQSWQLAPLEQRYQSAAAALQGSGSPFALTAPFGALDLARAQSSAAPDRLLPAGGGALAALSVFLVLAAYAMRHERDAEVQRLLAAGARTGQRASFALAEAALLSAVALVFGVALGIGAAALLAGHAALPVSGVLEHSVLASGAEWAIVFGWLVATAVVAFVLLAPGAYIVDVLAVAAAAALALTLTRGSAESGALPAMLAPLACVSAGVLVYRLAAVTLRAGERFARHGPPLVRLALVSLARAPVAPALAIAFVAVSTGLGGFALGYRATLMRGVSDQAANQVPLDALIAAGPSFRTPLEVAALGRWRSLSGGPVLPVRRTYASYVSGDVSVTAAALGIPASGLTLIRGWRESDGSAPLGVLARRLRPPGPVRNPGPLLGLQARRLALTMSAPDGGVQVSAELRDAAGAVTQLPIGTATAHRRTVTVRLPRGRFELEAFELDEPAGLEATNAHQNGENPAAATQASTPVTLGPLVVLGGSGQPVETASIASWRAIGAASGATAGATAGADRTGATSGSGETVHLRFLDTGSTGIVRPPQPSDSRPVPVLADPGTAAAAERGGRISLDVDGLPVNGQVVGVVRRFPTLAASSSYFVIADEATLASALDASLPGQGRPDELWLDSPRPAALRAALSQPPLDSLQASFRADIERSLRANPIARGVLGTLLVAAAIAAALALIGLLVSLLGAMRDPQADRELAIHGLGPRARGRELRARIVAAGALGLVAGFALAAALTRLAVAAVGSAATAAPPRPPLVTVAPWGTLIVLALAAFAVFWVISWIVTSSPIGRTPDD